MRLINADRLLEDKRIEKYYHLKNGDIAIPLIDIKHAPTIEERKKGKWIHKPNIYGVAYCSECDYELHTNDMNFCPNCGSSMMKGEEHETD